jgi:hypothetical protein
VASVPQSRGYMVTGSERELALERTAAANNRYPSQLNPHQ